MELKATKSWPDLFLKLKNIDTKDGKAVHDYWYIEVDRGTERSKELKEKCQRYICYIKTGKPKEEHTVFPAVMFIVPNQKRKEAIETVVKSLPERQKGFFVVTNEEYQAQLVRGPFH